MSIWSEQLDNSPIYLAQAHGETTGTHTTVSTEGTPASEHESEHGELSQWGFFYFSLGAFVLIALLAVIGTRRMKLIPRGLQNMLEWVFEALYGIPEMVMGPRGRKYAPLIATFFIYIVVMNFIGLIPFCKPGTASLSITLGLSTFAFLAVQYYGFQAHGIRYLLHFLGPVPGLAILIMPLEVVAELVRIASLSVRLFGNISGEEQVIKALSTQLSPFAAVVILPIQVLTVVLQAFVFSLLVTVYISLATEKHDDHGGAAESAAH